MKKFILSGIVAVIGAIWGLLLLLAGPTLDMFSTETRRQFIKSFIDFRTCEKKVDFMVGEDDENRSIFIYMDNGSEADLTDVTITFNVSSRQEDYSRYTDKDHFALYAVNIGTAGLNASTRFDLAITNHGTTFIMKIDRLSFGEDIVFQALGQGPRMIDVELKSDEVTMKLINQTGCENPHMFSDDEDLNFAFYAFYKDDEHVSGVRFQ